MNRQCSTSADLSNDKKNNDVQKKRGQYFDKRGYISTKQEHNFQYPLPFDLKISTEKTKGIYRERIYQIYIIVINNKPLEQVPHFQYLGCNICYDKYHTVRNKMNRFHAIRVTNQKNCTKENKNGTQI